jgi:hypothetical protein
VTFLEETVDGPPPSGLPSEVNLLSDFRVVEAGLELKGVPEAEVDTPSWERCLPRQYLPYGLSSSPGEKAWELALWVTIGVSMLSRRSTTIGRCVAIFGRDATLQPLMELEVST